MSFIANLWSGRVPLGRAFWGYAIICGLLINVYATLASFAIIAAGGAAALALATHLVPVPWIVLTGVGVWRSAGRPGVAQDRAALARTGVILWSVLLVLV